MPVNKKKKSNSSSTRSKVKSGLSWIKDPLTARYTAIAFALVFVVIGGYVIYQSSRASSAELVSGVGASGGEGKFCLDDKGNGGSGTVVDIWTCNGSAAQHASYDGNLIHVGTGCARVAGTSANSALGTKQVVIGACSPVPYGAYWDKSGNQFHNRRADTTGTTYCLDVSGGVAANGTPTVIYPCKSTTSNYNERWFPDTYGTTSTGGGGTTNGTPYRNPFHGASVTNSRIDQGVDFNGTATVYAIGAGTITQVVSPAQANWDGGWFIEERLSEGTAAGKYVYVAEDCTPYVHAGQTGITTSTAICKMNGSHVGIEMGWSAHVGTLAAAHNEYRENLVTSYGWNYHQLLYGIGAPSGVVKSGQPLSGVCLPSGWPSWGGNQLCSL